MSGPSWELVESFVRVAQAGSLTGAAKASGVSQPTLSRHIAELEGVLGVRLFDRVAAGVRLTPQGAALWERARGVGEQMDAFLRAATGLSEEVAGAVRVSVSESMSARLLGRWLAGFHAAHPQIELDWVVDNRPSDLLGREADIAVRMYRPTQLDLVARHIGSQPLAFYASPGYLERFGQPQRDKLKAHRWVGFDRDDQFIRWARSMGFSYTREDFAFRSDSLLAQLDAVRAGVGIGVLARWDVGPDLVEVLCELPLGGLPVWVVAHQEVHTSARVRRVFDALCEELSVMVEGDGARAAGEL